MAEGSSSSSSGSLKNHGGSAVELVTSTSSGNDKFLSSPSPEAATTETPTSETKGSSFPMLPISGDGMRDDQCNVEACSKGDKAALAAVGEGGGGEEEQHVKVGVGGGKEEPRPSLSSKPKQVGIPCNLNRYLLAVFFCLVVLLKGCTYWGWNGMQDMLYKSGAYLWVCKEDSTGLGFLHVGNKEYLDCSSRKNMINNLYTTIFATHFISSALSGILLDTAGPKICMIFAITVEAAGWLLIAFSSQSFSAYYVGGVFLGIAADPGYLPLLSVANLFPGSESFLMAILGSLRSISFAVPVILSAIFQSDAFTPGDFWKIVVFYVGVGLGLSALISVCFVPIRPFKRQSELVEEEEEELAQGKTQGEEEDTMVSKKRRNKSQCGSGEQEEEEGGGGDSSTRQNLISEEEEGDTRGARSRKRGVSPSTAEAAGGKKTSFLSALKSKEFLLIVPCFLIALLRAEFYTKSNKEQLQVVRQTDTPDSPSSNVYQMFSILNILSFLPGPLFGKLTDKYGILLVITILNTCGIFLYVFVMPNVLACKAISTLIYFVYCSFVLSNLYCYVAINFPSEFFGKLTGIASLIGGVFSLTSIGWYKLSSETLIKMSPHNFLIVDGIMVIFGLLNCLIIYEMWRQQKKRRREEGKEGGSERNKYTHVSTEGVEKHPKQATEHGEEVSDAVV